MTTTAVLLVVDGRPTTTPVKALLPPAPPFQPWLVLRGAVFYAALVGFPLVVVVGLVAAIVAAL